MYKVEKYLNKHELQLPTTYNDIQRQKNSAAAQTGELDILNLYLRIWVNLK